MYGWHRRESQHNLSRTRRAIHKLDSSSIWGSGGPPRALFEGRRRGDPLRGRPHGGGSATPFGLCPGPLPAGGESAQLEEYRLLERQQCHVGKHQDGRPRDDDDDAGECKVPVALKDPKQVSADSLQSPHDPDVTYSGHKGKGYEVQVAETCHEENATQLITHVEVTPSRERAELCGSAKPTSSLSLASAAGRRRSRSLDRQTDLAWWPSDRPPTST